ncbi:AAA family ATPase [Nonomuraea sp. NPDC050547]|uniref:AAA family ATPase n=1 Tax=Nonomuraea sp. NPDC050547 TaxID=3364368 RepID=UPI0037991E38
MPRHFAGLHGAVTLPTNHFQLVGRIIGDLVDFHATGVVHGPAGTGKTYAVEAALEALRGGTAAGSATSITTVNLAFPSRPTMRLVADELLRALTGSKVPSSRSRFYLTAALTDLLTAAPRLVVVDEAQRLTGDCIELLRHLHDHPDTRFALLYVGGDGCWEVLSREPMLRSRVFRRLPFQAIKRDQVPALMRGYHPIYTGADDKLLWEIDDAYGHGTLRDWAAFTHTAAMICTEAGRDHIDPEVIANACTLLGGGLHG